MKATLKVGTVWTHVYGDTAVDKLLYEKMAVEVEGARYSKAYKQKLWDGKKRFYDLYRKRFLTGLLTFVEQLLTDEGIEYEVENKDNVFQKFEVSKEDIKLEGIDWERFEKVQLPLLQEIGKRGRCAIKLATGGGKTEVMAAICSVLKDKKVLVLVHRIELLEQTKKRLADRLGEKIGKIEQGCVEIDKRITVAMVWSTISKLDKIIDWLKNDVDVVIADETHHSSANTWKQILMMCGAPIRVGLSGTPITKKAEKDMWLVGLTGEIVEGMSVNALVELGYAVKPVVRVVVDDRLFFGDWRKKFGYNYAKLVNKVYSDVKLMEVVGDIVRVHGKQGLVIFVERLNTGYSLFKYLKDVVQESRVYFTHGSMDKFARIGVFDKLKRGKINVLITTPILDEGVDVAGITGVVFACSNKSIVRIMQRIGRGVRVDRGKEVMYVYDMNIIAPWLFQHLQQRLKLYEEEGFEINFVKINKIVGGDYGLERIK